MKWFTFGIVVFLLIGAFMILKSLEFEVEDLEDKEDRKTFLVTFWGWIKGVGGNVVGVTGHVVSLDWLPTNETVNYERT